MAIRYDMLLGILVVLIVVMVFHKVVLTMIVNYSNSLAENCDLEAFEDYFKLSRAVDRLFKISYVVIVAVGTTSMLLCGYYFPPDNVGKVGSISTVGEIKYQPSKNDPQSKSDEIKAQSIKDQNDSLERFQDFNNKIINGENE